jgi:hypothetical protein
MVKDSQTSNEDHKMTQTNVWDKWMGQGDAAAGPRHTVVDVAACPGVPKLVSVGVIHSENGTCDKAALQEQHRVAPEGLKMSSCDRVCRLLWVHARLQTQHESLHSMSATAINQVSAHDSGHRARVDGRTDKGAREPAPS